MIGPDPIMSTDLIEVSFGMMSKGNPVFYGRDKSRKSKVAAGILKIIFRCVGTKLKEKASTIRRRL